MSRYKKLLTSAVAVAGLLLSAQLTAAEIAWSWNVATAYHDETSGTSWSSEIDTNGDGITGTITTLRGRSSRGPVTITTFSEFAPQAMQESERCPAGTMLFPMVESTLVYRFVSGDLLFLRVTDAAFCMNLRTGLYEFTNSAIVMGGTGRYAGATGTIEASGTGGSLSFHPSGLKHFGWTTMKNEGMIYRNGSD